MTTNRLTWTIKNRGHWFATYEPTGDMLVARSRAALMSKINEFERAL